MSTVQFNQDPTTLILKQLKSPHPQYLQVDYLHKSILQLDPEQAEHYEKSIEQQNLKEHFDDVIRDKHRELSLKHSLKTKFFSVKAKRPPTLVNDEKQPIEMIKSYSQPQPFYKRVGQSKLAESMISNFSRGNQKLRYAEEVSHLLQSSQIITKKKNRFRLRGGTIMQKQKMAEKVMRDEQADILEIIKNKDYTQHRPHNIDEIPSTQKYSLNFLDYLKQKTKQRLDKQFYERRVRRPNSKLQKFQQFVLQEGKFRADTKQKLSQFYIKMRQEFRRIERTRYRNEQLRNNSKKIIQWL